MGKHFYDIYLNTAPTGIIRAAECVLVEDQSRTHTVGFKYTHEYLDHISAFSIDPVHLPLNSSECILNCDGHIPGFIDDNIPDAWGKKVIAQIAKYKDNKIINTNCISDLLSYVGPSRIGAIAITKRDEAPVYGAGVTMEEISQAENIAKNIDNGDLDKINYDQVNLLFLANSGTGVGGARPKTLVTDGRAHYLAKFNRVENDKFNNAKVELACLRMAHEASLAVATGEIIENINNRDVLMLERFDVNADLSRNHLVSLNSLLKDPLTHADPATPFSYDTIFKILQKHSSNIVDDVERLLRQMLFNRAINNTDDHERNFSIINKGEGYALAKAYDLVPTFAKGQYHQAGFRFNPNPPNTQDVISYGMIFGLSKPKVKQIAHDVETAIKHWPLHAESAGLSSKETGSIETYFNLSNL